MLDKIFPTMRPNEITQRENTDTEKKRTEIHTSQQRNTS